VDHSGFVYYVALKTIDTTQQASQKEKRNERVSLMITSYNGKKSSSGSAVLYSKSIPTISVEITYK